MNPTGCYSWLLILAFDLLWLTPVQGTQVALNSPQFNHGIVYLNRSSTRHWTLVGSSIHSCTNTGSLVDAYYTLHHTSTSSAREVVIDITYTLYCCSHTLAIGLYTFGTSSDLGIPPDPRRHSYHHVTDLTNTTTMKQSRFQVFTTRSYVAVGGSTHLYIAFRNQGFCGSVDAISIHYFKCEAVSKNLVSYPETAAPRNEAKAIQISGRCMQQSFPVTTTAANTMICYSNGTSVVTGGCQCIAGYQNISDSKCSACPPKTFKPSGGNYHCSVCGANVVDGTHPRTKICQCKAGYLRPRAFLNAFHVNCEEPPSEPTNVRIETTSSTLASLSWSRPNTTGTGDDIWYSIQYGAKYFKSFTEAITLSGLSPNTLYNVTISSENNVTAATGVIRAVSISFITSEGLPSMVRDLSYKRNHDNSVTVRWKEPTVKGSSSLSFGIIVNDEPLKILHVTNYTIEQMETTVHYNVTVIARTSIGSSNAKTVMFSISGQTIIDEPGESQLPSMVQDLSYKRNHDNSVTVHWKEPRVNGGSSLSYGVIVNDEPLKIVYVTNYTIEQRNVTMHYNVTVMARTSVGLSNTQTVMFSIAGRNITKGLGKNQFPGPDNSDLTGVYIGVGVGIGVASIVAIIFLLIFLYRRKEKQKNKAPPDMENEEAPQGQLNQGLEMDIRNGERRHGGGGNSFDNQRAHANGGEAAQGQDNHEMNVFNGRGLHGGGGNTAVQLDQDPNQVYDEPHEAVYDEVDQLPGLGIDNQGAHGNAEVYDEPYEAGIDNQGAHANGEVYDEPYEAVYDEVDQLPRLGIDYEGANAYEEEQNQLPITTISSNRSLQMMVADMLENITYGNHLEDLAFQFGIDTSLLISDEPIRRFFKHLAHNSREITVRELKKVIEEKNPRQRIVTIFPAVKKDIENKKVDFTLESTLAELVGKGDNWIYFLKNVACKLPENNHQLLSWKDIAHHYGYDNKTIEGFSKGVREERPTVKLFQKLSQMENEPTIGTLKRHLRVLGRNDIIKLLEEELKQIH